MPKCAPSECFAAPTFGEALWQVVLELDLIDEGQEAAECYTERQVKSLRKWVWDNRLSLATFMGTTVDQLDIKQP